MGCLTLDNREGLDVKETCAGVDVALFILERHRACERDALLAAKDLSENRCHCDGFGCEAMM